MADIVPELLKNIQEDFKESVESDKRVQRFFQKVADGTAQQKDVHDYAEYLGENLSEVLQRNITPEAMPDGKLYWNIADRTIRPMLSGNYDLVNESAIDVQKMLDSADGIGLNAIKGQYPEGRIKGLIEKILEAEDFTIWLKEPIINCSESFFDDFVIGNADFRYRAGMEPMIRRTAAYGCCEWCSRLTGSYRYSDLRPGDNVYRRHEFCRCELTFENGSKRQNVWSKKTWKADSDTLNYRRLFGL